jgi:hypothetical protein
LVTTSSEEQGDAKLVATAAFERIVPEFVAQHPRSESATRLATASHTQTTRDVVFIRGAGGARTRDQRICKRRFS